MKKSPFKWKHEASRGNVMQSWTVGVTVKDLYIATVTIQQFKKSEYCLPRVFFPYDEKWEAQKTKSLRDAKEKCEKALIELAGAILGK